MVREVLETTLGSGRPRVFRKKSVMVTICACTYRIVCTVCPIKSAQLRVTVRYSENLIKLLIGRYEHTYRDEPNTNQTHPSMAPKWTWILH